MPEKQLSLAFKRLRKVFEQNEIDYRQHLFGIGTCSPKIKKEQANPITRAQFIARINDGVLEDFELAEKIAIGCQQHA